MQSSSTSTSTDGNSSLVILPTTVLEPHLHTTNSCPLLTPHISALVLVDDVVSSSLLLIVFLLSNLSLSISPPLPILAPLSFSAILDPSPLLRPEVQFNVYFPGLGDDFPCLLQPGSHQLNLPLKTM